jgi:simple sugar transport system substrate-binding protein
MSQSVPTYEPFTGPMIDRKGNEVLGEGEIATVDALLSMQWAAQWAAPNPVGSWPNEL